MKDILDLMQERHSARVPYDPNRPVTKQQLERIVEAASWAPTAHNMQNFEIVVVEDPAILQAIGAIKTKISAGLPPRKLPTIILLERGIAPQKDGRDRQHVSPIVANAKR